MNEKKECKIVQDLLPNFIEKVTTKETNDYIENHLKTCEECQKIYSSMTENLNAKSTTEEKEVKYLKKFHKQLKVLKIIILVLLLCFTFSIYRKTFILYSLSNKWQEYSQVHSDNYYARRFYYNDGFFSETSTYVKDGKSLSITIMGTEVGQQSKMTYYKQGNDELHLMETKNQKVQYDEKMIPIIAGLAGYAHENVFACLKDAFSVKIETIQIDNRECYVIKRKGVDEIMEKETGIMVKEILYQNDSFNECHYQFDIVTDNDVQRPDTTGYVMYDETNLQ